MASSIPHPPSPAGPVNARSAIAMRHLMRAAAHPCSRLQTPACLGVNSHVVCPFLMCRMNRVYLLAIQPGYPARAADWSPDSFVNLDRCPPTACLPTARQLPGHDPSFCRP
ncbi:uncharacterized protein UV8b_06089 [Ustilaginoidea virens]|uniref:Uncharacterized protein n=1 Tax=Ustilaginoidea virens TaxID=1159556 RepID=A0A8E5HV24_USTVR|nr:uncharacterized protein UV8b_06089 [Ustilaginoidea virens]QUC21848.1 hypothetical protein UV8b_06089 [Ustilaginoidea virens]